METLCLGGSGICVYQYAYMRYHVSWVGRGVVCDAALSCMMLICPEMGKCVAYETCAGC